MARASKAATKIDIRPPNFKLMPIRIEGTAPLMTHKFSEKARKQIEAKQTRKDATSAKREPKDYAAEFNAARYLARKNGSSGGWDGLPAGALRAAMIAACRTVDGLPMSRAKSSFFIEAQGHDVTEGTPLVRIEGKAIHDTRPVRNDGGGTDLRNRPRYDDWAAQFNITFDADLVSESDVANLLARAGAQVGLCELRPQGKNSYGGDFGTFRVVTATKKGRK